MQSLRIRTVASGFRVHDVYKVLAGFQSGVYTLKRGKRDAMRFTVHNGHIVKTAYL